MAPKSQSGHANRRRRDVWQTRLVFWSWRWPKAKRETVYFSKRDAATFFDSIQVPGVLQPWFGQPAVSVRELLEAGLSFNQVQAFCDDDVGAGMSMATPPLPDKCGVADGFFLVVGSGARHHSGYLCAGRHMRDIHSQS